MCQQAGIIQIIYFLHDIGHFEAYKIALPLGD